MLRNAALTLHREIHEIEIMAIATFLRIILFHTLPLTMGQVTAPCLELFDGIDSADGPGDQLFAGLNLAYDLIAPFMRYVTIGTDRAHAGTIGVMYGFTDFSDNGGVTARAEGFGISRLHAGVKGTPEQYAANKTHAQ